MLPQFVNREQAARLLEEARRLEPDYRITHLQISAQVLPLLEGDQRAVTERAIRAAGADVFRILAHGKQAAIVEALVSAGLIDYLLETLPIEMWDEETADVIAASMGSKLLVQMATEARSMGSWVAGRLLARLAARSFADAVGALALTREPPVETEAGKAAAAVLRSLETGYPDSSLDTLSLMLRPAAWLAVAAAVPISGRKVTEAISAQWGPWASSTFAGLVRAVPRDELPELYGVAVSLLSEWGEHAFNAVITYFRLLTATGYPLVETAIRKPDLMPLALALVTDSADIQSDQII